MEFMVQRGEGLETCRGVGGASLEKGRGVATDQGPHCFFAWTAKEAEAWAGAGGLRMDRGLHRSPVWLRGAMGGP